MRESGRRSFGTVIFRMERSIYRCRFEAISQGNIRRPRVQFAYSVDGQHFETAGDTWLAVCGGWVSARPGIFAANFEGRISPGYADFKNLVVEEI